MATKAESKVTFAHDEIRRWAEERGAKPACVKGTGGGSDVGMLRLDFPGYSGEQSLEHISWEDWFQKFDQHNLALIYQETTAGGQRSNFNKLVSRETAESAEKSGHSKHVGQTAHAKEGESEPGHPERARKAHGHSGSHK